MSEAIGGLWGLAVDASVIGLVSDVHGNEAALAAVLAELERCGVDEIICLGDFVDPMPGSVRVTEQIFARGMRFLRGNHEDYVITAFRDARHEYSVLPRYRPIRKVAATFSAALIDQMAAAPIAVRLEHQAAGAAMLCHASPESNRLGWRDGVGSDLAEELARDGASLFVCGHWHDVKTEIWRDKTLVSVGSVGLPLRGHTEAEFCVLEATPSGWRASHQSTSYDRTRALDEFRASGWARDGGAIAWLVFAELLTAKRLLSPFIRGLGAGAEKLVSDDEWAQAARRFLDERGEWEELQRWLEV